MFESLGPRLEGRIVVLEPLAEEHVPGLREAAADERIWTWMWTTDLDAWLGTRSERDRMHPFAVCGTARWSARRAT